MWIREILTDYCLVYGRRRDADHKDLKFAPDAWITFAKQLIVSTEDGATRGTGTAQLRHHVTMIITSLGPVSRNIR